MTSDKQVDGWDGWGHHVLEELKKNEKSHEALFEKLNQMSRDIATDRTEIKAELAALKVKAGIWGAFGGAIPVSIGLAIWVLKLLK